MSLYKYKYKCLCGKEVSYMMSETEEGRGWDIILGYKSLKNTEILMRNGIITGLKVPLSKILQNKTFIVKQSGIYTLMMQSKLTSAVMG